MFRRAPPPPPPPPPRWGIWGGARATPTQHKNVPVWASLLALVNDSVARAQAAASRGAGAARAVLGDAWDSFAATPAGKAAIKNWHQVLASPQVKALAEATEPAVKAVRDAAATAAAAVHARSAQLSAAAAARLPPCLAPAAPYIPGALTAAIFMFFYSPPVLVLRLIQRVTGVAFDVTGLVPADTPKPPRRRKFVALTIDDGPCATTTPRILEELAANGAHATMFVIGDHVTETDRIGRGAGHAALGRATLAAAVSAGCEIGNHTMRDSFSVLLSPDALRDEIAAVGEIINEAHGGSAPRRLWFRPGRGWFNRKVVSAARDAGYTTVLGTIWPWDTISPCPPLNALFCWLKAYSGGVIVLHDRRHHTPRTLSWLLPMLRRSGYEVLNLTEALEAAGGRIARVSTARSWPPPAASTISTEEEVEEEGAAAEPEAAAGADVTAGDGEDAPAAAVAAEEEPVVAANGDAAAEAVGNGDVSPAKEKRRLSGLAKSFKSLKSLKSLKGERALPRRSKGRTDAFKR